MKRSILAILTSCIVAVGTLVPSQAATPYTIVNLGSGYPYSINSSGNIVGGTDYWDGSTYSKSTLPGYGTATAINDNGEIAGQAYFEPDPVNYPDKWAPLAAYWSSYSASPVSRHVWYNYPDGVEDEASRAFGIDGDGNVVGLYSYYDTGTPQDGSLLGSSTMTSPDYPDPSHYDPYWSYANGASANGYVCGQYLVAVSSGEYEQLWDHGYLITTNFTDLGTLEGSDKTAGEYSRALAVNTDKFVVGYSSTASDEEHACVWTDGTYSGILDLGTLSGGTTSRAHAVNDASPVQVVGQSNGTGFPYSNHAFIWDATNGMRDLNSLVSTNSGWVLIAAYGINNSGRIVGIGVINNQVSGFLLIP